MSRHRFDPVENEFIKLSGGEEYIRKFEVTGMRWKPFITDEGDKSWGLVVFFSDSPHATFYGDDAKAVMKAFELPENPPNG